MSRVLVCRHRVRMLADARTGQVVGVPDAIPFASELIDTEAGVAVKSSAAVNLGADFGVAADVVGSTGTGLDPRLEAWIMTNLGDGKAANNFKVFGRFAGADPNPDGSNAQVVLPIDVPVERTVTADGQVLKLVNANITTP